MKTVSIVLLLFGACLSVPVSAQGLGEPPALGTAGRDLPAAFRLPPLRDAAGGELARQVGALQVGRRAAALGLTSRSAGQAWAGADATLSAARERLAALPPAIVRVFAGSRASQLNALLRDAAVVAVRVATPRLEIDEPVLLRRPGVWLDLGRTELRAAPAGGPRFLIRIEGTSGTTLQGGHFVGGQWGVLISDSQDVTLRDSRFDGLRHGGVVLTGASGFVLGRSRFTRIGGAPVLVHGDTQAGTVIGNEIVGNTGASNWHAGVVITDREAPVGGDPLGFFDADRHGVVEQRIDRRLKPPRHTLLAFNRIALNASSGIYSDGGVQTVAFDNLVEGNAKEGICLDNGSTANVLAMNIIRQNGKRWGKSDAELRLEFVERYGRLADGTAVAKTPGVSLDNAVYNVVYANQIDRNYGGGVKMVRTAFFNLVGLNVVTDNNEGANARFHFFGIELGAAVADAPVRDLDFTPSRGNVVFANTLRGPHHAGIFYGAGSTDNDTFDNSVFGARAWALEQVRPQANASLNNLSNLPSRNIDGGLDARLPALTRGRND